MKKMIQAAIAKYPEKNPSEIAKELDVSEWEVVRELGQDVAQEVGANAFDRIMGEVTFWGDVTFVVQNDAMVCKIRGTVPPGRHEGGYFKFAHGISSFEGHIKIDNLRSIYLIQAPTRDRASIQFFNNEGHGVFKICLEENLQRGTMRDQMQEYERLKAFLLEHYPVPQNYSKAC